MDGTTQLELQTVFKIEAEQNQCQGCFTSKVTPAQALLTEGTQPSTDRQSQVPIMGPVTAPEQ